MGVFDINTFLDELGFKTSGNTQTVQMKPDDRALKCNFYSKKDLEHIEGDLKTKSRMQLVLCILVVLSAIYFGFSMFLITRIEKTFEDQTGYIISATYTYDAYPTSNYRRIPEHSSGFPVSENFSIEPNIIRDIAASDTYARSIGTIRYVVMNTKTGIADTISRNVATILNGLNEGDMIYTYLPGQYININKETRTFTGGILEIGYIPTIIDGLESRDVEVTVNQELTGLNAFSCYDKDADIAFILKANLPLQVGDKITLYRDCTDDSPVYRLKDAENAVVRLEVEFDTLGEYVIAEGTDLETSNKVNIYVKGEYSSGTELLARKFCINGSDRYIVYEKE